MIVGADVSPQHAMPESLSTSSTLLRDIASRPDHPRWNEFASTYKFLLAQYVDIAASKFPVLNQEDRDDLVQELLFMLHKKLPGFRYSKERGRFRSYLWTIVGHLVPKAAQKKLRREQVAAVSVAKDPADRGAVLPTSPDSDIQLMLEIWALSYARLRQNKRFDPNTLAVFSRHALEGIDVQAVAEEFKMKPNAIYQIKDRILRAVRKDLVKEGLGRIPLVELHEKLVRDADEATSSH